MMPKQQWLSQVFRSLRDSSRIRRCRPTVAAEIQVLEPRFVLAVTTSVSPNINPALVSLVITVNGGDSVNVGTTGDTVTVNGTVVLVSLGNPLLAADVASLSIVCNGDFANSIDIGNVTQAAFPSLTHPSIFGGGGNDTIVGSELSVGGNGDVIDGGDGNDTIYAGDGNDLVYGGAGDDCIAGEGGIDSIFGDAGDDLLVAGGDAIFEPFSGNPSEWDIADGGSGCDTVNSFESHGGPGNDTVTGSTLIPGSPSGGSGLNIVNTVSDGGMSEECAGIEVRWEDGSGTASSDRVTYEDQSKPPQTLKISLTNPPGLPGDDKFVDVEITVQLLSPFATAEATVNPASIHFTNDNWSEVFVDVKGVDDAPPEVDGTQDYTVHVKVTNTNSDLYQHFNNVQNSEVATIEMANIDNDGDLFEVMTPAEPLTTEGGLSFEIQVRLKQGPEGTVMIPVQITGTDPDEAQSSVAAIYFDLTDWSLWKSVEITGKDDNVVDGNRSYTVVLGEVQISEEADEAFNHQTVVSLDALNLDDDVAGVMVVPPAGGVHTTEIGGTSSFSVRLTSEPVAAVTVSVVSSNTGEGTVSPSSLTFTSSNWNVPQTVTVTGVNDMLPDSDQNYEIQLGPASSSDPLYDGMEIDPVVAINIALPVVEVADTVSGTSEPASWDLSPPPGVFMVYRGATDISAPLVVNYTLSGSASSSDYATLSGSITIPANQFSEWISVTALADSFVEGTETVVLTLATSPNYQIGSVGSATVTISDPPPLEISLHPEGGSNSEDIGVWSFPVMFWPPDGFSGDLVLSYSTSDDTALAGSDYVAASGTLTFNNPTGPQTLFIPVTIMDDSIPEDSKRFRVTIALVSAPAYVVLIPGQPMTAMADIIDDDAGMAPLSAPPGPSSSPSFSALAMAASPEEWSSVVLSESATIGSTPVDSAMESENIITTPAATMPDSETDSSDGSLLAAMLSESTVDPISSMPASASADLLVEDNSSPATTELSTAFTIVSPDPTVASQYPNNDGGGETVAVTTTAASADAKLFAVGTSDSDLMEALLLEPSASTAYDTAPPGSDAEIGVNAQLQISADGSVAIGSLS